MTAYFTRPASAETWLVAVAQFVVVRTEGSVSGILSRCVRGLVTYHHQAYEWRVVREDGLRGIAQHYFAPALLSRESRKVSDRSASYDQWSLTSPPRSGQRGRPRETIVLSFHTRSPSSNQNNSQTPLNLLIVTRHSSERTQANPIYLPRKIIL